MKPGKKIGIGKRIKEARLNHNLTQEELAKKVGVTKGAIANYENDTSHPREPIIYAIMQILHIDANYLFQDYMLPSSQTVSSVSNEEFDHIKKYRTLDTYGKEMVSSALDIEFKRCQEQNKKEEISAPLADIIPLLRPWQTASAGYGQLADDSMADTVNVYRNPTTAKADYIMRVSGDSMEPVFCDGQEVLVREQPAVELGEIGIFIIGGERFIKTYRGDHLESANPDYPDVQFDDYSKCVGKVLGVLKNEWIASEV